MRVVEPQQRPMMMWMTMKRWQQRALAATRMLSSWLIVSNQQQRQRQDRRR
jgi:hypothetical protein